MFEKSKSLFQKSQITIYHREISIFRNSKSLPKKKLDSLSFTDVCN